MNECIDSTIGRIHVCFVVSLSSDDPRTSWSFHEGDITVKLSQCRSGSKDDVRHIKHNLLGGCLGEDGGLGDIKFQSCIFLEDTP